jgi:hypothetical protein
VEPVRPPVPQLAAPAPAPESQGAALEAITKALFDKVSIQQRLTALECGIDGLGQSLKPEIAELREEMSAIRSVLEDVLVELRSQQGSAHPLSGTSSPTTVAMPFSIR